MGDNIKFLIEKIKWVLTKSDFINPFFSEKIFEIIIEIISIHSIFWKHSIVFIFLKDYFIYFKKNDNVERFIFFITMKKVSPAFMWALERTKNYEGIKNFEPYDMAICALLDAYHPELINFKSLDPKEHKKNLELSVKVMEQLGILVYFYPDELIDYEHIDKKILLTQLSAVKLILAPPLKRKDTNHDQFKNPCNNSTSFLLHSTKTTDL